jgi:hypothetical protein
MVVSLGHPSACFLPGHYDLNLMFHYLLVKNKRHVKANSSSLRNKEGYVIGKT